MKTTIPPLLIGLGLGGLAEGWYRVYGLIATIGIILYVNRGENT